MKTVEILRNYKATQTEGNLIIFENRINIFECKTLELPNKNNLPGKSCIPAGRYKCTWYKSPRFSTLANDKYKKIHNVYPNPLLEVWHYLINDVPNRAGCLIHSIVYSRDLRGCIGLGSIYKDIDLDGNMDVIHSGETIRQFEKIINKEDFLLNII